MDSGKKIPCNHIFHLDCLRMWLQHQQSCPVCRAEIPSNATPTRRRRQPPHAQQPGQPHAQAQAQQPEPGAGLEAQAQIEPEAHAGAAAGAAQPAAAPAVAPHADQAPRPAAGAARRPPSPMPRLQRVYPAADLPIPANPQQVRVATPPVTPGGWRPVGWTPDVREEQVPAFYKVMVEAGVDVRQAPHRYASVQRHIAKVRMLKEKL
jgi:E3 ubiquitin-protein ligase synoviolin